MDKFIRITNASNHGTTVDLSVFTTLSVMSATASSGSVAGNVSASYSDSANGIVKVSYDPVVYGDALVVIDVGADNDPATTKPLPDGDRKPEIWFTAAAATQASVDAIAPSVVTNSGLLYQAGIQVTSGNGSLTGFEGLYLPSICADSTFGVYPGFRRVDGNKVVYLGGDGLWHAATQSTEDESTADASTRSSLVGVWNSAGDIMRVIPVAASTQASVDTIGTAISAIPTPPNTGDIASQVRTELTTELGRIDASITSRQEAGQAVTLPELPAMTLAEGQHVIVDSGAVDTVATVTNAVTLPELPAVALAADQSVNLNAGQVVVLAADQHVIVDSGTVTSVTNAVTLPDPAPEGYGGSGGGGGLTEQQAAQLKAIAQRMAGGKVTFDFSVQPYMLTVYDDDGTTVLYRQTVAVTPVSQTLGIATH